MDIENKSSVVFNRNRPVIERVDSIFAFPPVVLCLPVRFSVRESFPRKAEVTVVLHIGGEVLESFGPDTGEFEKGGSLVILSR